MDDLHNNCECVNGGGGEGAGTNSLPLNMQLISNIIPPYINAIFQKLIRGYDSTKNTSFMFNANVHIS
jgi:hypothetical protein